ncbi:MAG: substrate-binding domain-containing protein [Steroidobacteraceae bacterium]
MNNFKIAAAVALAIGSTAARQTAFAAPPTAAQCAHGTAAAELYVAGSSAAQPSFATALANDLFDSNGETTIAAPKVTGSANGNFKSYCGFAKAGNGAGIATGAVTNVYYRGEGGSVVGALPIVSGQPVKFLDLTASGCAVTNPSVVGLSVNVGTTDGWSGCVTEHAVEMGVTDLEPTVFVPPNYPSAYSTTVFGSASKAQLAALTKTELFQQVFGLFVNTSGINGGAVGQAVDLSRETVAQILAGNYTDWSAVPTSTGGAVSSVSQPITIVNREAGSGTRTGATTYFLGTNCNTAYQLSLFDPSPGSDGYATGDVLATAASTPGAITYASIDNNGAQANLTMVSLSGISPTNLAATSGAYDWWFEATAQKGNITSAGGTGIYNWLIGGELANLATAPHAKDINVIPNLGTNGTAVPVHSSTVGGVTIYVNPFTRSGNSCKYPVETN